MENSNLMPLEGVKIRKTWHNEEWYFSVVDVIEVLTDSPIPRNYWSILKKREPQLHTVCMQLKIQASDGRQRLTDCANTEGVLRIVMSVPSPKAEPLKLWLANVGKRDLEEMENPELGFERMRAFYKAKGYPDEWIGHRLKTIDTRKELTEEWKNREVKDGQQYSILTAIIAKGTFGLTPSEHKNHKNLTKPSQQLRDHMTPLELIFTALSEETAKQYAIEADAKGFDENQQQAAKAGYDTGETRKDYEKRTNIKVVSDKNYLKQLPSSTDTDAEKA